MDINKHRYVAIGKVRLMGIHQFGSLNKYPNIAAIAPELKTTQANDRLVFATD
jgi:hypothetical protein